MLITRLSKSLVRNLSSLVRGADHQTLQDRAAARQICIILLTEGTNRETALSTVNCKLSNRLVAQVFKLFKNVNPDAVVCFLSWAAHHHGFIASSVNFTKLLVTLARAFNFPAMWNIIDEMNKLGYVIPPAVLTEVIRCYGRANMAEEALSALEKMQNRLSSKPDVNTYKALVSVLVSAGHLTKAVSVYINLTDKGMLPSTGVCATILHGMGLAGDVELVMNSLRQLGSSGCKLDATIYNALIRGYLEKERYEAAYQTFQGIRKTSEEAVNSVTFEMILSGCVKSGSQTLLEAGVELYEEMVSRSYVASSGVVKSLVSQLIKLERTREAYKVVMRDGRYDVGTYTRVLDGLCKRGDCELAMELLKLMQTRRVPPNVVIYSCLIDGLCKGGRLSTAVKTFQEMQAAGCAPNTCTYNSLINGLCISDRLEDAFALLKVMKGKGCEPSLRSKNTLMNGICKQIIAEWSRRQFSRNGQRLFQEGVARSVAAEDGKLSLLYEALEYMFNSGDHHHLPDQFTYSIIIHFLSKVQKVKDAARVWNAMKRKLEQADVVTYNSFLYGLVQMKNSDEAARLFSEIQTPSLVSHSLLLDAFVKEGDFTSGSQVYQEMERLGWPPDVVVYNILLNGLCKARLESQAGVLYTEMLNNGVCPSVTTYSILIHAFCSQGRLAAGMEMLERMKERGCMPGVVTYNTVLYFLFKEESVDEGVKVFREMKRCCGHSPATWNIVIDGILRVRELADAESLFLELLADGMFPEYITYDTLVDRILEVHSQVSFAEEEEQQEQRPPQQQQQQQQQTKEQEQQQRLLSFGYSRVVDFFLDS